MKRMIGVLLACRLLLPTVALAAEENTSEPTIKPILLLNHIKVVKPGESEGDELYLSLAVYRGDKSTYYLRIPEKPMHWSSTVIDHIKQMPIWSEPLKNGEAVSVVVSLVESDDSIFNPDDVIGDLRVKFKNENGVLHTKWSMPNRMDGPTTVSGQQGDIQKFLFVGEDGVYEIYLSQLNKP